MKVVGWLGIGLVAAFMVGATMFAIPGPSSGVQSLGKTEIAIPALSPNQPEWNSGNLCSTISYPGPGDVTCVSLVSSSSVPLWYNFSAGTVQGGTVTVVVDGSADCINLNFHSFYSTIMIELEGSYYSCAGFVGSGPPPTVASVGVNSPAGLNVVVNSEGDLFDLVQDGAGYYSNVTIYGTTTYASTTMWSSQLNTTYTYIGTKPGFSSCPSGIVDGRVAWSDASYGSDNTFNTVFIDGTNTHVVPPNYAYSTETLLPPDGNAFGTNDLYGNETTQTAPVGSCQYLGV
ncbi:MAG: hypothetical protein ACLP8Y_01880 [Thermoplasmata archaeon]